MWCRECQQDVPGVATPEAGQYACPRCGQELSIRAPRPVAAAVVDGQPETGPAAPASAGPAFAVPREPPPRGDGWELEEQLRHLERILAVDKPSGKPVQPPDEQPWSRLDAAHAERPAWHVPRARKTAAHRRPQPRRAGSWLALLTWSVLSLGSMAMACGGVLLAWSIATGRDDLWSLGMPIVLVAQLVLLVGFILQLDRLSHQSRSASERLEHVGRRLDELNTTTSLLGTSPTSPGASFYSHMAGGANPQLLLADLKSQLDLLALKLSRVDR